MKWDIVLNLMAMFKKPPFPQGVETIQQAKKGVRPQRKIVQIREIIFMFYYLKL